LFTNLVSVK